MTYGRYKQGTKQAEKYDWPFRLGEGMDGNLKRPPSDFNMVPDMDWINQQPGYRPGGFHMDPAGSPSRSQQMGGWMEQLFRTAVTGGNYDKFGISPSGQAKWDLRGDFINNWVTNNAQFVADNRDNQEALTSRMWEDLNAAGLRPNFKPDSMTQVGAVMDGILPWGGKGNAYRLKKYMGGPGNDDDAIKGFQNALAANLPAYIDHFSPTIRTQVMKNMLGGVGGDLAGFFSKLLRDGGVGSVGLIAKLIGLFDPNFANYTRGLVGIKQQPVDGSDGGTPRGTPNGTA